MSYTLHVRLFAIISIEVEMVEMERTKYFSTKPKAFPKVKNM